MAQKLASSDVKTIQGAYEAFNRGDIPTVTEAMDSKIEWYEPGGGSAPSGKFTGPQSVVNDVFNPVLNYFQDFKVEFNTCFETFNDQIVVLGTFVGKPKGGTQFKAHYAHIWKMKNGKAVTFYNYVDPEVWSEAWGK